MSAGATGTLLKSINVLAFRDSTLMLQYIFDGRAGPIPRELGGLTALKKLGLSNNGLTGKSPRRWV